MTTNFLSTLDTATIVFIALVGFVVIALIAVPLIKNHIIYKRLLNGEDVDNTQPSDQTDGANNINNVGSVNDYYRWQPDRQIVLERTPEQKRIVDEYFIIKNVKTVLDKKALLAIGILSGLVGIVLLVFGLIKNIVACNVIGVVAAVIGVILTTLYYKTKKVSAAPAKVMSDSEYEKLVQARIESLKVEKLGLQRLGLDEEQISEIRPIILSGKVITDGSLTVYNKDSHQIHSSTHYVTLLYFTDEQLFVYKIQFDMCCNMQDEWTSELFYVDICDVSSYINNNILSVGQDKIEYSSIEVSIVATNSKMSFTLEGNADRFASIQAMKQKIREKKM